MDAPPIQYARTEDGVSIAYSVSGAGVPILRTPAVPFNNVAEDWDIDEYREWYEALGGLGKLIRYDPRGQGLSDRDGVEYSRAASLRDMEAVAEQAGPGPFVVFGQNRNSVTAIDFALAHPDRVHSLVLWSPPSLDPDHVDGMDAIFEGSKSHRTWPILVRSLSATYFDWTNPELVHKYTNMAEQCTTRESFEQQMSAMLAARRSAARERLHEQVRHPTLVLVRRDSLSAAEARAAASEIAGSRLVALSGEANPAWAGDIEPVIAALESFLGDALADDEPTQTTGVSGAGTFRTILFTDVVASTPLLAQLKDAKMREVMRDHDAVLQAAVDEHGGRVVKEIGDAFMADFAVPSAAVECAIAMQRGIQQQFADSDVTIRLRIGINAGEPVEEDGDLHGASVVIAKRLESAAETNGILVSDVVKQAVVGKDFEFHDEGDVDLKGFDDPVHAWSVEWA